MAKYAMEKVDLYREAREEFVWENGREPNDLDKSTLQGEVVLRLLLRLEVKIDRIESRLDALGGQGGAA